tara:strand:- start:25914 stop:30200 length:4287 start_codon:yes stop_codon:yes gene_type:complete
MDNYQKGNGPVLGKHATQSGWLLGDHNKWDIICIIGDDPSNPAYAYHFPMVQQAQENSTMPPYWLAFQNETALFVNDYNDQLYGWNPQYDGGIDWTEVVFNPMRFSNRSFRFGGFIYKDYDLKIESEISESLDIRNKIFQQQSINFSIADGISLDKAKYPHSSQPYGGLEEFALFGRRDYLKFGGEFNNPRTLLNTGDKFHTYIEHHQGALHPLAGMPVWLFMKPFNSDARINAPIQRDDFPNSNYTGGTVEVDNNGNWTNWAEFWDSTYPVPDEDSPQESYTNANGVVSDWINSNPIYGQPAWRTELMDCVPLFGGIISEVSYDNNRINIQAEDILEKKLNKSLPSSYLELNSLNLDKHKGNPYPMLYGTLERAPMAVGQQSTSTTTAEDGYDLENTYLDIIYDKYDVHTGGFRYNPNWAINAELWQNRDYRSCLYILTGKNYVRVDSESPDGFVQYELQLLNGVNGVKILRQFDPELNSSDHWADVSYFNAWESVERQSGVYSSGSNFIFSYTAMWDGILENAQNMLDFSNNSYAKLDHDLGSLVFFTYSIAHSGGLRFIFPSLPNKDIRMETGTDVPANLNLILLPMFEFRANNIRLADFISYGFTDQGNQNLDRGNIFFKLNGQTAWSQAYYNDYSLNYYDEDADNNINDPLVISNLEAMPTSLEVSNQTDTDAALPIGYYDASTDTYLTPGEDDPVWLFDMSSIKCKGLPFRMDFQLQNFWEQKFFGYASGRIDYLYDTSGYTNSSQSAFSNAENAFYEPAGYGSLITEASQVQNIFSGGDESARVTGKYTGDYFQYSEDTLSDKIYVNGLRTQLWFQPTQNWNGYGYFSDWSGSGYEHCHPNAPGTANTNSYNNVGDNGNWGNTPFVYGGGGLENCQISSGMDDVYFTFNHHHGIHWIRCQETKLKVVNIWMVVAHHNYSTTYGEIQVQLEIWGEIDDSSYIGSDPVEFSDAFRETTQNGSAWAWRWYNNSWIDGTDLTNPANGQPYVPGGYPESAAELQEDPTNQTTYFDTNFDTSYGHVHTEYRGLWTFPGEVIEETEWNPPLIEIRRPTDVMYNILAEELNVPEKHFVKNDTPDGEDVRPFDKGVHVSHRFGGKNFNDARKHHENWFLDFSVANRVPAKRLLSEIAQNSKSIPHLTLNSFKFINIKDTWTHYDVNHYIWAKEILNHSFYLTPVSEIISNCTVKFKYDYGLEAHLEETAPFNADTFIDSNGETYDVGFYNLPEFDFANSTMHPDSSETYESNYIQDGGTATQLAQHRVQYYCNRRLRVDLELPIKYLYLGLGDVIKFMDFQRSGPTLPQVGNTVSDWHIGTAGTGTNPYGDTPHDYANGLIYGNYSSFMQDGRVSDVENFNWDKKPFGININGEKKQSPNTTTINGQLEHLPRITPYNGQDLTPFFMIVDKSINLDDNVIQLTLEQLRNM